MFPSPMELDAQSSIQLDGWVDLDSERWREVDDDPGLTKKFIRLGFQEPAFFFTDSFGRIWGKGENGKYYPYHLSYGKKKYGIRIAKKAAN
jgi:hypothetical protein